MDVSKDDFAISKLGRCAVASPLCCQNFHFEKDDATVVYHNEVSAILRENESGRGILAFEKGGPREFIFHDPTRSKAAIVTAGGLCPGLNDVIKGLTLTLKSHYGIPAVYGIRYGFQGLNPEFGHRPLLLDEETVDDIHLVGGSILGSSRGHQDVETMVSTLEKMGANLLFCVGGDGTLRCVNDIVAEVKKRRLGISVVAVPKTIDNDINFIEKSFGFETAVYATNEVITSAHNEAKGFPNGIGLIRVMGRDSGFIAAYAALANTHVNYCLVPEEPFPLHEGDGALIPHLLKRLERKQHAVIIVAEGAGQDLIESHAKKRDRSGNLIHGDIGLFLKEEILKGAKKAEVEVSMKYFDPSYLIRSIPAHGTDAVYCLMLAQNAVHAAMSGRTGMVVGNWHNCFTHVPVGMATRERKKLDLSGPIWRSVKTVTWPR